MTSYTYTHVSLPPGVRIQHHGGHRGRQESPETQHSSQSLEITGPLGRVCLDLQGMDPYGRMAWRMQDQEVSIMAPTPALAGFWRSRLRSLCHGVTRGYACSLYFRGIGYRVRVEEQRVYCKLGLSHDVLYVCPAGIRVYSPDPTHLVLFGVDQAHVHQVRAEIIALRPPSAYQLKGIYSDLAPPSLKSGKRK